LLAERKILLLSSDQSETDTFKSILSEPLGIRCVGDLLELQSILQDSSYDAVLCGWSFQDGTWNDALGKIQQSCPAMPVIIFCKTGGEREWIEVLDAGAFDLLIAPYQRATVLTVLEHAVAAYQGWKRVQATPNLIRETKTTLKKRSGRGGRVAERRGLISIYSGPERRGITDRRYQSDRRKIGSDGGR